MFFHLPIYKPLPLPLPLMLTPPPHPHPPQGLFHPARKVREVYWRLYNNVYIGAQVRRGAGRGGRPDAPARCVQPCSWRAAAEAALGACARC